MYGIFSRLFQSTGRASRTASSNANVAAGIRNARGGRFLVEHTGTRGAGRMPIPQPLDDSPMRAATSRLLASLTGTGHGSSNNAFVPSRIPGIGGRSDAANAQDSISRRVLAAGLGPPNGTFTPPANQNARHRASGSGRSRGATGQDANRSDRNSRRAGRPSSSSGAAAAKPGNTAPSSPKGILRSTPRPHNHYNDRRICFSREVQVRIHDHSSHPFNEASANNSGGEDFQSFSTKYQPLKRETSALATPPPPGPPIPKASYMDSPQPRQRRPIPKAVYAASPPQAPNSSGDTNNQPIPTPPRVDTWSPIAQRAVFLDQSDSNSRATQRSSAAPSAKFEVTEL